MSPAQMVRSSVAAPVGGSNQLCRDSPDLLSSLLRIFIMMSQAETSGTTEDIGEDEFSLTLYV